MTTALPHRTIRSKHVVTLVVWLVAAGALLAQTAASLSRDAAWGLDAPRIAEILSKQGVSGVPSTTGWDVVRPVTVRFSSFSTPQGAGIIHSDTFTESILGLETSGPVDERGGGLGVPRNAVTVVAEGAIVFAEHRGPSGQIARVQIGALRREDGLFVPDGEGGGGVTIKSVEYLPDSPGAPDRPRGSASPLGFKATPVSVALPYRYVGWEKSAAPTHFLSGTLTVTYYVIEEVLQPKEGA
jgi:hypothetical protein